MTIDIKPEDLAEVFSNPPVREVALELRFAPRLRVTAELWRLQELLVDSYPEVSTEPLLTQGGGAVLTLNSFQNRATGRVVKVSIQNFIFAVTKYSNFEEFKEELIERTTQFCTIFEIRSVLRIGLRYVNDIALPAGTTAENLGRFVRPLADLKRIDPKTIDQFLTEFRCRHENHLVTVRGALLAPGENGARNYILDIDSHSPGEEPATEIPTLLDGYHDTVQRFFLNHVTDEYKSFMRSRQ